MEGMRPKCVIFGNTVTLLCNIDMCKLGGSEPQQLVEAVPSSHLSITGTLTTTNVIMANWSRQMWQSGVNKVVRTLALGPLGSHFFWAVAAVS
ncbi:hypothetical protein KIN20_029464 [Parelaphostrongylus tenuis]|uniref:Uncharacterized protein n=1 Tax=Parelaphostrongylus tenuis TaxID=148309 RepID=A0AAD5WG04_PARTN|nr:hypothetical protein KIN20_029464 [Parelaphostrongylus tenuis]